LQSFGAASEVGDYNSLALPPTWLHENFRDCGRLPRELPRGPLSNIQNNVLVNPDLALDSGGTSTDALVEILVIAGFALFCSRI
jgi:hypothetical protein